MDVFRLTNLQVIQWRPVTSPLDLIEVQATQQPAKIITILKMYTCMQHVCCFVHAGYPTFNAFCDMKDTVFTSFQHDHFDAFELNCDVPDL